MFNLGVVVMLACAFTGCHQKNDAGSIVSFDASLAVNVPDTVQTVSPVLEQIEAKPFTEIPAAGVYDYSAQLLHDSRQNRTTLWFREGRGEPEGALQVPPFTCEFVVAAQFEADGGFTKAKAHFNGEWHRATLSIEGQDALRLRYQSEPGGCVNTSGPDFEGGLTSPGIGFKRATEEAFETGLSFRLVAGAKVFLYKSPQGLRSGAFMVSGDVVKVLEEKEDWRRVAYESWAGKKTTGWLKEMNLVPWP